MHVKSSKIPTGETKDAKGGLAAASTKIGKLTLTKGSVALFAVSEIHEGKYAIVNHTRNLKGFIPLTTENECNLKIGQLIVASVTQT